VAAIAGYCAVSISDARINLTALLRRLDARAGSSSLARDRYVELDRWLAWVAADGDVRGEAVVAGAD